MINHVGILDEIRYIEGNEGKKSPKGYMEASPRVPALGRRHSGDWVGWEAITEGPALREREAGRGLTQSPHLRWRVTEGGCAARRSGSDFYVRYSGGRILLGIFF